MTHFAGINQAPSPYSMLQQTGRVATQKLVPRTCLRYLQTTLIMVGGGLVSEFVWGIVDRFRGSCPEVFCKKGVLKNFAKFTGKHLSQSLFLIKLQPEATTTEAAQKQPVEVFCSNRCSLKFNRLHRKTPVSMFLMKLQAARSATPFKKETPTQEFSCVNLRNF